MLEGVRVGHINPDKLMNQPFLCEIQYEDGGSPAARLRFARLTLARLGLNDGAKLQTKIFYNTY